MESVNTHCFIKRQGAIVVKLTTYMLVLKYKWISDLVPISFACHMKPVLGQTH